MDRSINLLALSDNNGLLETGSCNEVPLLVIPSKGNSDEEKLGLYNVIEGRRLDSELRVPSHGLNITTNTVKSFCGSSHGWLALFDTKTFAIILINPFTVDAITLPSLPLHDHLDQDSDNHINPSAIRKVVLSADPHHLTPDDKGYFVISITNGRIAIIRRPSDHEMWTWITDPAGVADVINDAIFHSNGHLYAVDGSHNVFSVELSRFDGDDEFKPEMKMIASGHGRGLGMLKSYIVESSEGDILVIGRYYSNVMYDQIFKEFTKLCMVYKMVEPKHTTDDHTKPKSLVHVKSIGNDALFLGRNSSMSVPVSHFNGCQPNAIYFTDDYNYFYLGADSEFLPIKACDSGVFTVEEDIRSTGLIRFVDDDDDSVYNYDKLFPMWILPSPGEGGNRLAKGSVGSKR